jgi:hypothetical protein
MEEGEWQTKERTDCTERDSSIWHGVEHSIIDTAIDESRKRLRACIRAKRGHFEHLL